MRIPRLALLVLAMVPLALAAQDHPPPRPKIGLALSGGGAKGFAHIGVLRVLEQMNVPVDFIAGASMGSVIGALYASGMSPDEIENEFAAIDWNEALNDATPYRQLAYHRKIEVERYPSTAEMGLKRGRLVMPTGLRTGQRLTVLLGTYLMPYLDEPDFMRLPIPFKAVASDLATGTPVLLERGDLAQAVRASMSIPGAFTPVDWNGRLVVDGGVTMNVPVEVVRNMGADIVIAVDISDRLAPRESITSTFDILDQLTTMLTRSNMGPQLANADLVLTPDIGGYGLLDFEKAREIVKAGVAEAEAKKQQLAKFAIAPRENAALVAGRRSPRSRNIEINEIRVEGNVLTSDELIIHSLQTRPGSPLDLEVLQRDIERLYGWGDFAGISFGLARQGSGHALILHVQEKPWGPDYVRTGLNLSSVNRDNDVSLLLNYTKRWINQQGMEWRNDLAIGSRWAFETELYQPRKLERGGFIAIGASFQESAFSVYVDRDEPVAEYLVRRSRLFADLGAGLGSVGEVRVGVFHRWTDATRQIGVEEFPDHHSNEAGLSGSLKLDTRDNPFIPLDGQLLDLDVVAPLNALGAEKNSLTARFGQSAYKSRGRHSGLLGLRMQDTFGGAPELADVALLGGLLNLGGYPPQRLSGDAAVVGACGYYFRVAQLSGIGKGVYAGVIGEAGDVYPSLSDFDAGSLRLSITTLLAVNTNFGPIFFAVSQGEGSGVQYYVTGGRGFSRRW